MKKLIHIIILVFIVSCSSTNLITVTNIHDMANFSENSRIYALPRTRLKISITALSHKTIPGPYSLYAEKFLGIKNVPDETQTSWEIINIQLDGLKESDPDYFFSVKASNDASALSDLLEFTKQGLIVSPDATNPFSQFHREDMESTPPIPFTDLSVKRNVYTESRKIRSKPGKTNVPIDLPTSKSKQHIKTLEEKAEEAANFIIKIRKRRFKLVAGQYAFYPEGEALKTGIKELDSLEDQYLSLFIGKTYTDTVRRTFFYVPNMGSNLERNVLCRFSDVNGFEDPQGNTGTPMILELKNMGLTAALEHLQLPEAGPNYENTLFYRVPDLASAKIFYGSLTVLEAELNIFQYGSIVPYSVNSTDKSKK